MERMMEQRENAGVAVAESAEMINPLYSLFNCISIH
jgi:hypothetical protein